jgi:hypothetical protein
MTEKMKSITYEMKSNREKKKKKMEITTNTKNYIAIHFTYVDDTA